MTLSTEERNKLIAACREARANHDPEEAQRLFEELPHWDETAQVMAIIVPNLRKKPAGENPDS